MIFDLQLPVQSVPITTNIVSNLDTTFCNKVCQWFSPDTLVSSTNKTDRHDITEILLKVALNTIKQNQSILQCIINRVENKKYHNDGTVLCVSNIKGEFKWR